MSDANTREPNLLIIRRGGSTELEAPKGGVWKIAYADFMTAMMAFFLVMWLINATSETTKTGVANYFNPIKLAEGQQLPKKGLQDPEEGEHANSPEHAAPGEAAEHAAGKAEAASEHAEAEADEAAEHAEAKAEEGAEHAEAEGDAAAGHGEAGGAERDEEEHDSSEKKARFSEEALFRDPYAVLAAIAAQADGATSLVARGGGHGSVGAGGEDQVGESYGDPFDPAAWQVTGQTAVAEGQGLAVAEPVATPAPASIAEAGADEVSDEQSSGLAAMLMGKGAKTPSADAAADPAKDDAASGEAGPAVEPHAPAGEAHQTPGQRQAHPGASTRPAAAHATPSEVGDYVKAEAHSAEAGGAASGEDPGEGEAGDPATRPLREQIAKALDLGSQQVPNVTVESADGGVLISLADQVEFGMFAVGSAEPLPETIAVMEKIAAMLNTLPGKVIIRGHTDGRPFRSDTYDNWRLSSARAHMAYHMLVRGGLDESRVERIEGYADRALKLPDDPDAAENRRIDILVQEVHS